MVNKISIYEDLIGKYGTFFHDCTPYRGKNTLWMYFECSVAPNVTTVLTAVSVAIFSTFFLITVLVDFRTTRLATVRVVLAYTVFVQFFFILSKIFPGTFFKVPPDSPNVNTFDIAPVAISIASAPPSIGRPLIVSVA